MGIHNEGKKTIFTRFSLVMMMKKERNTITYWYYIASIGLILIYDLHRSKKKFVEHKFFVSEIRTTSFEGKDLRDLE